MSSDLSTSFSFVFKVALYSLVCQYQSIFNHSLLMGIRIANIFVLMSFAHSCIGIFIVSISRTRFALELLVLFDSAFFLYVPFDSFCY